MNTNINYNLTPLKINLYLENNEPTQSLIGGGTTDKLNNFVDMSLINNNVFKYLKSDLKSSNILWFKFNPKRNINIDSNTSYIERGIQNVDFVINYLYKISNVSIEIPKDNILLKLINLTNKTLDEYIAGWVSDVKLFSYAIPEIFAYGQLFTKDGTFISNYIITKKYDIYESLLKLNYNQAVKFIIKMLFFLNKLVESNIILRNFKFSNIGYDFINSQIEFIIRDYTDTTLIKKSDNFFNQFTNGCDGMCAGTLVPYFIIKDFFELDVNWPNKLNRLYSIGLAEILIFILYKQDNTMEELFSLLYYPSEQKPSIHYYKYLKLFDNPETHLQFNKLLNKLVPKYIEMDKFKINPMYIRIILNCFEKDYNHIKPPGTYLITMQEIYSDVNDKKNSNAKGLIKPINNENQYFIKDIKTNIVNKIDNLQINIEHDYITNNQISNTDFINHLLSTNNQSAMTAGYKLKRYKLLNSFIINKL